jgi:hypothetical protein
MKIATLALLLIVAAPGVHAQTRGSRVVLPPSAAVAPVQVAAPAGGLDAATRQQIVDAVAEAKQALARLRNAQNARCEAVKERTDLAAEQVEAKLERILLALDRAATTTAVVPPPPPPGRPGLLQPVDVREAVDAAAAEAVEPPFLSGSEVLRLSQAVAAESFAEDQLRVLRLGVNGVPVQVSDAKGLLERFTFAEDKLKALQILAPYLYDRQNAFQLLDTFTFSDDKEAAQRILSR